MDAKPTGRLIGYARVSTEDQELRMQLDKLTAAGCTTIYKEHVSASKLKHRKQLDLALMDLRPGDTLVVYKLDRLTRRVREFYVILDRITEAGAGFKSLTERIDWSTSIGRLLVGVMVHFAQFEAELTAERTAAGIKAIRDRGGSYGPKMKLSETRAAQLVRMRRSGATAAEVARKFKVSVGSVRNYVQRAKRRKR